MDIEALRRFVSESAEDSPIGSDAPANGSVADNLVQATTNGNIELSSARGGLVRFLARPLQWRRHLIQHPWWLPIVAMHLAATTIQRTWRSSWLRLVNPLVPHEQTPLSSGNVSRCTSARQVKAQTRRVGPGHRRTSVLRQLQRRYFDLLRNRRDAGEIYTSFDGFAAALIQGAWRSRAAIRRQFELRKYMSHKHYHVAAFEIQLAYRSFRRMKAGQALNAKSGETLAEVREVVNLMERAATRLQRAWRNLLDRRAFETLKDTIFAFRRSGDPYLLLRSILPREAMLLDPAMQVHVRFRLGGSKFPPSIYYKIYTHGAVVDVGAFAPRNYAAERRAKEALPPEYSWYEREENNGWRPLISRLAVRAERMHPGGDDGKDEVERATSTTKILNFQPTRLRRRQDLERRRKKRTVEWMQKLYGLVPQAGGEAAYMNQDKSAGSKATHEASMAGPPSARGGAARVLTGTQASCGELAGGSGELSIPPTDAPKLDSMPQTDPFTPLHVERPTVDSMRSIGRTPAALPMPGAGTNTIASSITKDEDEPITDDVLVEWSRTLDFDAYMESWKMVATSDGSEGTLPISYVSFGRSLLPTAVH
mmetsp:Transcript_64488/g.127502  ORF Transcript_64488/g.127502 Transcript_64488/m.127502 type:complete len:594 (+) Transcript_64488:86-1867(+)